MKRSTVQRRLTLEALRELNIHATAEQVYGHVAQRHPSVSKATVYRNLSQMAAAGEILNIGSFSGAAHYDHQCFAHYHFICGACGQVFDVDDYLPDICGKISGLEGFAVTGHDLTFRGLCPGCRQPAA